jgi:hypothetical protein
MPLVYLDASALVKAVRGSEEKGAMALRNTFRERI